MTQWQKAQTDSAAWPCEAEAWKKEKKIDRETMDVGLWEWLGGGGRCSNYGQKFSFKCYTSHRMVPEVVAVAVESGSSKKNISINF